VRSEPTTKRVHAGSRLADSPAFLMTHTVDKGSFIPLYYQIERALMNQIQSGVLAEGDPFFSEEELSKHYKVSRMTVRQALQGLKIRGYAVSEKGRGTFVARPQPGKNILLSRSFAEEMRSRGMAVRSRLLNQSAIELSDPGLATQLKCAPFTRVLRLRRLHFGDGVPMAIEESNVPLIFFPDLDRISFANRSLDQTLRDLYGVRVAYVDEAIGALSATREESRVLKIPQRSSMLSITRLIVTDQELPVQAVISHCRADRYRVSRRMPVLSID